MYLLRKKQMSGYHAELFSYVLHLEVKAAGPDALAPLRTQDYESVYGIESEPHMILVLVRSNHRVNFTIESVNGRFRVSVSCAELTALPEVEAALASAAEFGKELGSLRRDVPRADIHAVLRETAQCLAALPQQMTAHA